VIGYSGLGLMLASSLLVPIVKGLHLQLREIVEKLDVSCLGFSMSHH
jgi:hypothetical protein